MARVNIDPQEFPGSYPTLPLVANSLDLALTAADTGDGNMTPIVRRRTCLLAINTHASTAYTVTVTSVADVNGRTGDLGPYTMQAGEIARWGPFDTAGWAQVTGDDVGALYFAANNAAIKFAVLELPAR